MKTYERDANMDLMRITAMLLVMVFHVNYYNIALEEGNVSNYTGMQLLGYSFMKCISMVCVNMFILISGWYGIHPSIKGFCKLVFQIWFFSIPTYLILCCIYVDLHFSFITLTHIVSFGGYWFIPAYLLLYICAPILNMFVLYASRSVFKYLTLVFFRFEFFVGWLKHETYFDHGCSPLAFCGLYLVARYIRLYSTKLNHIKTNALVSCYIFILSVSTVLCCFLTIRFGQKYAEILMQYISPFNIMLSVLLLVLFTKIKIKSHYVNKIGISCFSAYLLHGSPFFYNKIYYPLGCKIFYIDSVLLSVLSTLLMIVFFFLLSIMIDFLRIAIWEKIERNYAFHTTNADNKDL